MPALKSSLRFLALGACADVATAFGTLRKGDYVDVKAESSSGPACPCDGDSYCQIIGRNSMQQPDWGSFTHTALTEMVSECWNRCFKDPSYLDATAWEPDPISGNCPACERYPGDGDDKWGCECGAKATFFDECNIPNAEGDSKADIWYTQICGPSYKPGGELWDLPVYVNMSYQTILRSDLVPGLGDAEVAMPYNPFLAYEKEPEHFSGPPCAARGAVDDDADQSAAVACAGILAPGSKNVGDADGCAAEGAVDDCSILYYYGESWIYYCKPEYGEQPYPGFTQLCSSKSSEEECGTRSEPKYFTLNPWQNWNICRWDLNWAGTAYECKEEWPYHNGWTTKPTLSATSCVAPDKDADSGEYTFRFDSSTCKQQLCGDSAFDGLREDDAACFL